ncbi:MAG: hypothetical protein IJR99_05080 [Kiritimatiellae bacterium]|nr:hypothetical protein [Kiritimatiellia bacterium]
MNIMNLLPGCGNEYKACLHTHTTVSDGDYSPAEIKKIYRKAGYSVVAFTDHELLRRHDDLADDSFLPLAGHEVALWSHKYDRGEPKPYDRVHLNLIATRPGLDAQPWLDARQCARYAKRDDGSYTPRKPEKCTDAEVAAARLEKHVREHPDKSRYFDAETVRALVREAREAGFLVALNHPVWSYLSLADADDFEGLWAVEVYNRNSELAPPYDSERDDFYDALLRGGRNPGVCCLATDDAHTKGHLFHGWVVIRAPQLDLPSIAAALEKGCFYSSTGPTLQSARLEGNVVRAETSPCKTVRIIDAQGVVGMQTASVDEQSDWEFKLGREPHGYVRMVAEALHGTKAWTMARPVPA